jgi:hypothetical protein
MKKWWSLVLAGIILMGMVWLSGCGSSSSVPQMVLKARDWGIEEARREGIEVPHNVTWSAANVTPPLIVGYSTYAFTYGNFRIEVGYPVVLYPVYTVTIYENGAVVWTKTVEEQELS